MFEHFDPILFTDPNFKEDSVREVIIAPMLSRLGYHPTGKQAVVRSKSLVQPFIYAGTRRHPVTIIPDYTLTYEGRIVLVLDAKSPVESVSSSENIQQAYSYAIHPEIRTAPLCAVQWKALGSLHGRFLRTATSGICQWKLDTLLNNLDSKCRVDICFG